MQGDVIGIYDNAGNTVAKYAYDAWGKVVSIINGLGADITTLDGTVSAEIGIINPIRYRGYYYDAELKLYYLNSRYYDAEVCRFVNADEAENLFYYFDNRNYYNLFAYAFNSPINFYDSNGESPVWAVGIIAGLLWGVLPRLFWDIIRGKFSSWQDYLCDAVSGALGGLIVSLTGSTTLGSFIGTFCGEILRFILNYDFKNVRGLDIVKGVIIAFINAIIVAIASIIAGNILKKITGKSFSSKQIKNFFNNTKNISSALGLGSGGKTARRIWALDAGLTTLINSFLSKF